MRDPDLVFRAQLAAAALEGSWHRWRVVHGLAADPMPTVSSYVGYSLEEPWGQPRVVFGLAAEDAEQLATLLERHDCVGPVYAAVATLPGSRDGFGAGAGDSAGAGAGQRDGFGLANRSGRPGARYEPLPVPRQAPSATAEQSRTFSGPDTGAELGRYDEPVFRQAAAALAEAAAARDADGQGEPGADLAGPQRTGRHASDVAAAERLALVAESAESREALGSADAEANAEGAEPGSLARAASAARAEAEARIKAALTDYRASAARGYPYLDVDLDGDPLAVGRPLPAIPATDVLEPLPRPEAASGAYAPQHGDPRVATNPDHDSGAPQGLDSGPAEAGPRRSRGANGNAAARLPKSKHPGPSPVIDPPAARSVGDELPG
jgi:hypothetical protein